MRLADSGEVFGHFLIPVAEEDRTRKALAAAVKKSTRGRAVTSAKLASIAGECDLLLHLCMRDFRIVADLQADVIDSYSLATSWVYAIPYEEPGGSIPPGGGLEFFIYLRIHRHYYACYGAAGERAILKAIAALLKSQDEEQISGRVLYSLGWPDLIVHGLLCSDLDHLRKLIVSLQSLSFPTVSVGGRGRHEHETSPIFLKTITLLGMPIKLKGRRGGLLRGGDSMTLPAPLLLGRSRPGQMSRAIESLSEVFAESGASTATAWALDGTWDFLITSLSREPISLARFYRAIRRSRRGFSGQGVERTQTHLLTSGESDLARFKVRKTTLRPEVDAQLLAGRCHCAKNSFDELRGRLEEAENSYKLPRGLVQTISHALEMFRHTLRESSNCCDSIGALRAHVQGLEVLLNLSSRAHKFLDATPAENLEQQALIATEISYINSHLVEWCKRAGRVVREKTAGSSGRLFLQIDSIVAQRGAIPKILMIAERIMQDLYRRLPPELHGPGQGVSKREFAAILEPLGNLTSQPLMGLVTIPVRYAFALHLVVPQLWHEVGQYVFWAEYSPWQRARVDFEIAQEPVDTAMTPSRQKVESFAVDFHLRADMFADLLVFCFGFAGDLRNFFLYLASLTANVAKHDNIHQRHWERQALALVQRLLFVAQFLKVHKNVRRLTTATRRQVQRECLRVQDALIATAEESQKAVRKVIALLLEVSQEDGWPKQFRIPSNLVERVAANLNTDVYARCLRDMAFVAYHLRDMALPAQPTVLKREMWEAIEGGELVELESAEALEAAYREFYLEELHAQLAGQAAPPRREQFRKMATLGRSALLHIYKSGASTS